MEKIFKRILRAIVTFCIGSYCTIVYRVKTVGRENIPEDGNLIFCGNHRSFLDAIIIVLRSKKYVLRFMAKEELKNNPFTRLVGYLYDVIYVKRDSKDIGPIKEALKTLKAGYCVGIFPEGTRNGFEKNNGQMKDGAAYIALKTGAKLVPIGIVGDVKPFHRNTFIYGKPIDISEYQTKDKEKEKENITKVSEILKTEILRLTSESK